MKQILKVKTDTPNGDEFGNSWLDHYILYQDQDDDGQECFDLYEDDGQGNGSMVCRGYSMPSMRSLALRLGEFVEWEADEELPANYDDDGLSDVEADAMTLASAGMGTDEDYMLGEMLYDEF